MTVKAVRNGRSAGVSCAPAGKQPRVVFGRIEIEKDRVMIDFQLNNVSRMLFDELVQAVPLRNL